MVQVLAFLALTGAAALEVAMLRRTPTKRGRHRGDLAAWMLSRHRVARLAAERQQRGAW